MLRNGKAEVSSIWRFVEVRHSEICWREIKRRCSQRGNKFVNGAAAKKRLRELIEKEGTKRRVYMVLNVKHSTNKRKIFLTGWLNHSMRHMACTYQEAWGIRACLTNACLLLSLPPLPPSLLSSLCHLSLSLSLSSVNLPILSLTYTGSPFTSNDFTFHLLFCLLDHQTTHYNICKTLTPK